MSASFALPVRTVLADGTYPSELRPPRKKDGPPIVVRVIEYSVIADTDDGEQVSELSCLATTLLDPEAAPAADLAGPYHDRWQAETTIGDLKTTQRGGPEVLLRSKTPTTVAQESWAMVCVHQAVRDLLGHAGRAWPGSLEDQLQACPRRRPRQCHAGGSLPPRHLVREVTHLACQLRKPANLIPLRPGRTAPRARRRGPSHRYGRPPATTPAVQTVTYRIAPHPLPT
jgi:hypothetical protein